MSLMSLKPSIAIVGAYLRAPSFASSRLRWATKRLARAHVCAEARALVVQAWAAGAAMPVRGARGRHASRGATEVERSPWCGHAGC